jgi:hypothetical protein
MAALRPDRALDSVPDLESYFPPSLPTDEEGAAIGLLRSDEGELAESMCNIPAAGSTPSQREIERPSSDRFTARTRSNPLIQPLTE